MDDQALERRIRDAVLPRADELDAYRPGLHTEAWAAISTATRAILTRGRLASAHYDVLVEPFTGLGAQLPPHDAQDDAG